MSHFRNLQTSSTASNGLIFLDPPRRVMSRWDSRPENQGISLELVQSFLEEKGFDVAVQDREGHWAKPLGGSSQVGTGWSLGLYLIILYYYIIFITW